MHQMNICIATSSFPHVQSAGARFGGGGFALDFAQELAALGHRITVVTSSRTDASVREWEPLRSLAFPRRFKSLRHRISNSRALEIGHKLSR